MKLDIRRIRDTFDNLRFENSTYLDELTFSMEKYYYEMKINFKFMNLKKEAYFLKQKIDFFRKIYSTSYIHILENKLKDIEREILALVYFNDFLDKNSDYSNIFCENYTKSTLALYKENIFLICSILETKIKVLSKKLHLLFFPSKFLSGTILEKFIVFNRN